MTGVQTCALPIYLSAQDTARSSIEAQRAKNEILVAEQSRAQAELTLNLRAEAEPEVLKAALDLALGFSESFQSGMTTSIHQLESFRPGRPTPTHRES